MFLLTRTTSHKANLGRQIWKFLYMQAKANENRKKITKTLQQHPLLCDYTARSRSSGAAQAGIWERRGWDVVLRTWCGAGTLQVRLVAGHSDLHTVLSNHGDSVIVWSASTAMPPAPLPGTMEEVSKPGIKLPLFLSTAMPQHGLFSKAPI